MQFDRHHKISPELSRIGSMKGMRMASTQPDQDQATDRDPLRHHEHYQDSGPGASPYAGGSSFMERMSEAVASGMGTVGFLLISSAVIIGWVLTNHVVHFLSNSWKGLLNGSGFDPAPFILLNLVFSAVAFYTGALVIIAQKAQTRTDKANEEAAAKHRDELNELQTDLLRKNTDLTEEIHDLTAKMNALTVEVHNAICRARGAHQDSSAQEAQP
jgi:uncharacterized membrane protein